MQLLEGAAWGAFGGFAMDALDFIVAVRRWQRLPWEVKASSLTSGQEPPKPPRNQRNPLPAPGLLAYAVATVLRVTLGAGTAAAMTATFPHTTPAWSVVIIGAAAPHVLEKITTFVPLIVRASLLVAQEQNQDQSSTGNSTGQGENSQAGGA